MINLIKQFNKLPQVYLKKSSLNMITIMLIAMQSYNRTPPRPP